MNMIEKRRQIEDNLVDNGFEIARCATIVNAITDYINQTEKEMYTLSSSDMTQSERDQVAAMREDIRKRQGNRSYYRVKMLRLIGVKSSRA